MKRKALIVLVFVAGIAALAVLAGQAPSSKKPADSAAQAVTLTEYNTLSAADARPDHDRGHFALSANSIARGDLLACRNPTAAVTQPGSLTVQAFSDRLSGVWLNENRRSVHGMPVWTDAVFFIQMNGANGVGLLIDRNNLGSHVLSAPFRTGAYSNLRASRPASMKQVNCTFEFVDEFVKVSDTTPVAALAAGTGTSFTAGMSLVDLWGNLLRSGYFDRFEMPLSNDLEGPTQTVTPQLGDGQRVAITADGALITEAQIGAGLVPGAEYELPMLTAGLFRISLAAVADRPQPTVRMRWDAEYRGVGMGLAVGEPAYGLEQGEFVMEGDAIVSARNMYAAAGTRAPTAVANLAWETSECAIKSGLDNPALSQARTETITTATGETISVEVTTALQFERYVIGTPGGVVVADNRRPEPVAVTAAQKKGPKG